jgi:hypothetical protein
LIFVSLFLSIVVIVVIWLILKKIRHCKGMELTQRKNTITFKQLDGTLRTMDKETGKRISLSHKCGELDKQIPQLLGVSKSILEHVRLLLFLVFALFENSHVLTLFFFLMHTHNRSSFVIKKIRRGRFPKVPSSKSALMIFLIPPGTPKRYVISIYQYGSLSANCSFFRLDSTS